MLISLKKIYKDYYKGDMSVPVLKDINLDVEKGDYLAIMGPSGSGKSTLMNILGCLDTPTKGNYDFDGKNILLMNDRELAKLRNSSIGFVFQRFNLLNEETALQNVMLPLRYSDVPAARRSPAKIMGKALGKTTLFMVFHQLALKLTATLMSRVSTFFTPL